MFHVEQFLDRFLPEIDKQNALTRLSFVEQEYLKWNKVINISSIRDKEGFWLKHVLDSLCLVSHISKLYKGYEIFDVGSGGGFPGLVLAICLDNKITMIEPIKKKTDFIDHCILRLKLNNAKTMNSKYEDLKIVPEKTLIVSRALGEYDSLYDYFIGMNNKIKFVLMTTTKQKFKFSTQNFSEEYDFINVLNSNIFKNHTLAQISE